MSDGRLILPPGVEAPPPVSESDGRAIVINETGLPNQSIEDAARAYFVEESSVGGIGRSPSNFQTYSANQGSMLARTEYQTPTNVIEEIKLARELAERDDDVGATIGQMLALAFGEGMLNQHEDERTVGIYNAIAQETNLDRVLRELYREYLIAGQVNTVSLFTRTSLDFNVAGSSTQRSEVISWPVVGVLHAEDIRVIDNDMFGTGTLAYLPPDQRMREWLDEFFNPKTSPARKHEMAMQDRVAAAMFIGIYPVDPWRDRDLYCPHDKLYLLNPRMVQRHTMPKGSWKYPRPLLTRDFALLEAKRLLNIMDFALLQGGANFIVVAKKGTDQLPAQPPELMNLKEVVRRASRTGVIVGDHRLTFDVITPELKELLNSEKRRLLGRKLARGLLRLAELEDTAGAEGFSLDAELIGRVITNDRHEIKRHVERSVYSEIRKRNPRFLTKGAAKLWFPKIVLQGLQFFNDMVLKLRDRGDISRSTAVSVAGFDWDAEVQRRKIELARGDDETMIPGQVPHSSPDAGPQDNGPGRPAGSRDGQGQDPARPRRQIQQTPGETIRAWYDDDLEQVVRVGDATFTILEQHPDYAVGRMTQLEREMLAIEQPTRRADRLFVPVNDRSEVRDEQAIRVREGFSMIVGEDVRTQAKIAKLLVFHDDQFETAAAEDAALRWGFEVAVQQPEPPALPAPDPVPDPEPQPDPALLALASAMASQTSPADIASIAEAIANAPAPVINVHVNGEPPETDPKEGE